MKLGYHASHEQMPPSRLLALVQLAARRGFQDAMCSDHIAPFTPRQGHSGFAWSWLGAALATTPLTLGTVNAPGQRYHPVIIAQAIATLGEMFPGRFWVALGSGQLINEHVVGGTWPPKARRQQRLLECAGVIRGLLRGETVSHEGEILVEEAVLYVRPSVAPPIFAAAVSPETAEWAGAWGDGLITVYQPGGRVEQVLDAFRRGGGAGKPVFLQAQHAFAPSGVEARERAHAAWPQASVANEVITELRLPAEIAAAAALARCDDTAERIRCSADPRQHLEWLREYAALGFDSVYLHNVAGNDERFIEVFGEEVIPQCPC